MPVACQAYRTRVSSRLGFPGVRSAPAATAPRLRTSCVVSERDDSAGFGDVPLQRHPAPGSRPTSPILRRRELRERLTFAWRTSALGGGCHRMSSDGLSARVANGVILTKSPLGDILLKSPPGDICVKSPSGDIILYLPNSKMLVKTARELSHLIRDRRKRLLLTQAQLAKAVGASRKWIIDLEAGKPTTDLSLVLRTIRALGVELDARERSKASREGEIDLDSIINSAQGPKR